MAKQMAMLSVFQNRNITQVLIRAILNKEFDMSKEKSRPTDNSHCFEGVGRRHWFAIASGFQISGIAQGPDGSRLLLRPDATDGYAIQNGGINSPQESRMPAGSYYRFVGTVANNAPSTFSPWAGGWWIDYETMGLVRDWAIERQISLARAASQLLAIPKEWGDCGYLGKASLNTKLKAWVGTAKPASGGTSPDSANRDPKTTPITLSPHHLGIKQYFVPGQPEQRSTFFQMQWTRHVLLKGSSLTI